MCVCFGNDQCCWFTLVEVLTIPPGSGLLLVSTAHDKRFFYFPQLWNLGRRKQNKRTLTTFTRDYAFSFSVPSLACLSHPPMPLSESYASAVVFNSAPGPLPVCSPFILHTGVGAIGCVALGKQLHMHDFCLGCFFFLLLYSVMTTRSWRRGLWTCPWMNGSHDNSDGCYANCGQTPSPFFFFFVGGGFLFSSPPPFPAY